jgi:hypothetical protein
MVEDTLQKVRAFLLRNVRNHRLRTYIGRFGDRVIRLVGVVTVVSAIVTFALAGSEFFTKTVPKIFAATSRTILLAGTLRPILIDYILRDDLGYQGQCLVKDLVIDLDRDGWASDLIIGISPKEEGADKSLTCSHDDFPRADYALILKELPWSGWRPKYTLLHTFSSGIPTDFEVMGPFVVITTAAQHYPGYHIFAYGSGTLYALGSYRIAWDEAPNLQVGGRLFIKTTDGYRSFEITPLGQAGTQLMTARDVVARNNAALIIEDGSRMSEDAKTEITKPRDNIGWVTFGDYAESTGSDSACKELSVFKNGDPLDFKQPSTERPCTAEVKVDLITQISFTNISCSFSGFTQSPQFPWGWLYDATKSEHEIRCPEDDRDSYDYVITVKLE